MIEPARRKHGASSRAVCRRRRCRRDRGARQSTARRIHDAVLLILILVNLLVVSSCARFETVGVLTKVIALDGAATVLRKGETTPLPLTIGQRLAPGDMIRSSDGARATLSLVPGIRIVLLGGSELLLERLDIRK